MRTTHRIHCGDARDLSGLPDDSVELVVTSPPYPMIEMWDDVFGSLEPAIEDALSSMNGSRAFELMHTELDAVWEELSRVLIDGGIACINVGDATRSMDGDFQVYSNHSRILSALAEVGFVALPEILWRKPTNSATKFMGSGMLPTNAYPTLEHEYLLICRNGSDPRSFPPSDEQRYESAFFWEERNAWFTDVWTDVTGTDQGLRIVDERDRSGAFPLAIPHRLINMFSIYDDTVLDPFWGTGTTTLAAMLAGRNSVGIELSSSLIEAFDNRVEGLEARSKEVAQARIDAHRDFVEDHRANGGSLPYAAKHYDFPVKTKQERDIRFHRIDTLEEADDGYSVTHAPFDDS